MAFGWTGSGQIAFELQGGNNVLVHPKTPDLGLGRVVGLKAGGQDHRSHIDLMDLFGIIKIYRPGVTDFFTEAAGTRLLRAASKKAADNFANNLVGRLRQDRLI